MGLMNSKEKHYFEWLLISRYKYLMFLNSGKFRFKDFPLNFREDVVSVDSALQISRFDLKGQLREQLQLTKIEWATYLFW